MDQLRDLIEKSDIPSEDQGLLMRAVEAMSTETQNMFLGVFKEKPHWVGICASNLKEKILALNDFDKDAWNKIIQEEAVAIEKELS
jgi:hypothetical protein